MKVVFKTNLDNYQVNCFPDNLITPPRIGESVLVTEGFGSYFIDKRLPTKLIVVDVTHTEQGVLCELHYSKIDIERANLMNINLF